MQIKLSDHFTTGRLLRFALPTVVMMMFTSVYGVVDGMFISNYVGTTGFAAINLIFPAVSILGCPCFMLGIGGSALVGKTLGEGRREKADGYFSMIVWSTIISGLVLTAAGLAALRPLAVMLGAEGQMLEDCILYGGILILTQILYMLQVVLQFFLVTAEKPKLNLGFTVASGLANIVLDYLFVGVFRWGLAGAAFATAISQAVGCLPIVYFALPNKSLLRLCRPCFEWPALFKVCTNGVSELMGNISASVVSVLYNFQLLRLAGENGLAAYGVIMYVTFLFQAVFIGYSFGCAPVVSFHFGAKNTDELKNLFKCGIRIIGITGLTLSVLAELLSGVLSRAFVGYDDTLAEMTRRGFRIYSVSFLISCYNSFGSNFFTALNDGFVSAVISFSRTFVFQIGCVGILPFLFGLDGVWVSLVLAEFLSMLVTFWFIIRKKDKYHYL